MKSKMGYQDRNEKGACCPSRREFLAAAGLSAALFPLGTLSLATASAGESSGDAETPRILAALVRPDVDRYSMNWRGDAYDIKARQADYTKTLNEAAVELGVQMDLHPKVLADEGCQGIAIDCLPHVRDRSAAAPCLGFSCLNDQGTAAACQPDWPAAVSLRLTYLLLNRPGFMQNICVNTVNNRLMGAHCTCPTLLAGPGQPAAPFVARSHAESDTGVAVQVIWPALRCFRSDRAKFNGPIFWRF